ncbi:hypothetical protein CEXT_74161 [Caerostris extrusa]|uniref:Uncharacterized protein n=1 Tax=Caerostris extrusa TaxID=172846 RepID=A0AAV4UWQ3_CAEEX|nr:hypothetical protein CEXT_74161 [Caerostris extrusa]
MAVEALQAYPSFFPTMAGIKARRNRGGHSFLKIPPYPPLKMPLPSPGRGTVEMWAKDALEKKMEDEKKKIKRGKSRRGGKDISFSPIDPSHLGSHSWGSKELKRVNSRQISGAESALQTYKTILILIKKCAAAKISKNIHLLKGFYSLMKQLHLFPFPGPQQTPRGVTGGWKEGRPYIDS